MRRKGLDRSAMLEASKGVRRKDPLIVRMLGAIIGLFIGRRRR
jgi:hypothetical protein